MLMASSSAILTDAFPANQRGMALGRQHGGRGGRIVPRSADRRLSCRSGTGRPMFWVGVPIGILGTIWSYRVAAGTRVRTPGGWTGQALLTFGVGLTVLLRRDHLRHSALRRRRPTGWTSPWVLGVDRIRPAAAGGLLLHRAAGRVADGRHPAVPVGLVRHGQPGRADVVGRPRRPAVHADHLAAGHLASTARLQLRIDAAVGGHLSAPGHVRVPGGGAGRPASWPTGCGSAAADRRRHAADGGDLRCAADDPGRTSTTGCSRSWCSSTVLAAASSPRPTPRPSCPACPPASSGARVGCAGRRSSTRAPRCRSASSSR